MSTSLTLHRNPEPATPRVQVVLPGRAVWRVPSEYSGETLHVVSGTVWVTLNSEGTDHILHDGENIAIPAHTTVVVQGLPEARIEVA